MTVQSSTTCVFLFWALVQEETPHENSLRQWQSLRTNPGSQFSLFALKNFFNDALVLNTHTKKKKKKKGRKLKQQQQEQQQKPRWWDFQRLLATLNISCLEAQSWTTLCDPMDYSLLGSSVHGIFHTRTLEWVAISFSWGFAWHRNRTGAPVLEAHSLPAEPPG